LIANLTGILLAQFFFNKKQFRYWFLLFSP
jgi:hypothetical protein